MDNRMLFISRAQVREEKGTFLKYQEGELNSAHYYRLTEGSSWGEEAEFYLL